VTFLATNDLPATELNKPFQRTMNTPGSIPGFLFYPHVGQVDRRTVRRAGRDRHGEPRARSSSAAGRRARRRAAVRAHDRLDARQARVPPAATPRRPAGR
jgi:hypothetical protein